MCNIIIHVAASLLFKKFHFDERYKILFKESLEDGGTKNETETAHTLLVNSVWPVKNRQMSIKVAQKCFTRKMKDFDTFTKLRKIVGDLGN